MKQSSQDFVMTFTYANFSEGEKMRIDLALLLLGERLQR